MGAKKKAKTKKKTIKRKPTKRTGGGSKLTRTEIVQVRLDPKLRYAAELAAIKHRRTLSSFIEWCVEEGVSQVVVGLKPNQTANYVMADTWDARDSVRFILKAVSAAIVFVVLQLPVADFIHTLLQQAGLVSLQERIPLAPPDDFNNVPAGAPENPFELLYDFTVAAHRAIQPLQVTVDHKSQAAELLSSRQGDCPQGFGLGSRRACRCGSPATAPCARCSRPR